MRAAQTFTMSQYELQVNTSQLPDEGKTPKNMEGFVFNTGSDRLRRRRVIFRPIIVKQNYCNLNDNHVKIAS